EKKEQFTVAFDELKITLERPGKPDRVLLGVVDPAKKGPGFAATTRVLYASKAPPTAAQAPTAAIGIAHHVEMHFTIAAASIYAEDEKGQRSFDLRDLAINLAVETVSGKKVSRLSLDGTLDGPRRGKVHIALTADLGAKP